MKNIFFIILSCIFMTAQAQLPDFAQINNLGIVPVSHGGSGMIDANNDGFPEKVFFTGAEELLFPNLTESQVKTRFYDITPNGPTYLTEDTSIDLPGVVRGVALVRDINNDSYPDIFLMGARTMDTFTNPDFIAHVYMGDENGDYTLGQELTGLAYSMAIFFEVDTDNDGIRELHLATSGRYQNGDSQLIIYAYRNGNFILTYSEINTKYTLKEGAMLIINNDNDIDDEVQVVGVGNTVFNSFVIDYNNGNFVLTDTPSLDPMAGASMAVADLDNDGNKTIISSGFRGTSTGHITQFNKINNDNTISEVNPTSDYIIGYEYSDMIVYDFDADGDDDLYISGSPDGTIFCATDIYVNNDGILSNTPDTGFTPQSMCYATSMIIDVRDNGETQKILVSTGNETRYQFGNNVIATAYVIASTTLSVGENLQKPNELELYPNPVIDQVTITLPNADIDQVHIYTIGGRSVLIDQLYDNKLSLAHLSAGIYVLQVRTTDGTILSKKIVKK